MSNSSSIKIKFVSDGSVQRGGFSLLLTSFHTGTCSATEFSCDTDRFELLFLPLPPYKVNKIKMHNTLFKGDVKFDCYF